MRKAISCVGIIGAATLFVIGPGRLVQGQGPAVRNRTLRAEGAFLGGLGWYELNDARARSMNTDTAIKVQQWNKQVYDTYMRERSAHMSGQKGLVNKSASEAERRRAERERRLRTSPERVEIQSGDALNAMLVDLSAPSIPYSAWRLAQVPLPEDLAIRDLVFRFIPMFADKRTQELSKGLVALGRLDLEGRWPVFLPEANVGPERKAYDAAYRKVRDKCLAGALGFDDVRELDVAIERLKARAATAIPEYRGFRREATQYIEELIKVTRMFDAGTLSYAQEMIADTQRHNAGTVGELLAFMRKYSLMFGTADLIENGGEKYARLYGLLQEQRERLGANPNPNPAEVPPPPAAPIAAPAPALAPAPAPALAPAPAPALAPPLQAGWASLFNGNDLTGWSVEEGDPHTWTVENGVIVAHGDTVKTRNYLLSDQEYADFALRFEFNLDKDAAAGAVFRATAGEVLSFDDKGGRMLAHPFVRLSDGNPKGPTGCMYWTTGLFMIRPSRPAIMNPPGAWNQMELELKGRSFRLTVNGSLVHGTTLDPAARLIDGNVPGLNRAKGRIGFQKHTGVVRYRNIAIREL